MTGKITAVLTGTQNSILYSIKNLQRMVDKVQLALASGKEISSAIEGPQNFFLSKSLLNKAQDLSRLLDGIKISIRTIQTANDGLEAILKIVDQIDSLLQTAIEDFLTTTGTPLSDDDIAAILAANPGVLYSPDSKSFYLNVTTPANWATAYANAQNTTLIEPDGLSGIAGVGGHLPVISSQLENDFVQALSPGWSWLGGSDQAVEGEWRWIGGPEDGQQFWQGLFTGSPIGGLYENWGAAEPNQVGNEDHLHLVGNGTWNDLSGVNAMNYAIEWDESLFTAKNDPGLQERKKIYAAQYLDLLDQIDQIAKDANYLGIGLLTEENLKTFFNADNTNFLLTEGVDATSLGLGLVDNNFNNLTIINTSLKNVRAAKDLLRSYTKSLQVGFGIVSTRLDFTQETINIHKTAGKELVIADQNEKGAEFLALQAREQIQVQVLRLSNASNVNNLFA
jgi:flagellin-like hook-associated protein FlgL